jgi:hypothetical protein
VFSELRAEGVLRSSAKAYDGPRLLGWLFHIRPVLGARRLRTAAAYALALFVAVAQPVAFLAWLGGAHATPEQAALHEAAVEHGHTRHHGAPGHHAHDELPRRKGATEAHFLRSTIGSEFASAAPHAGPFHDLHQTLLQAMLVRPPDAPSPGEAPRAASFVEALLSQHSPPVPHRPPILLLPDPAIL